jgi:hypothetical protein
LPRYSVTQPVGWRYPDLLPLDNLSHEPSTDACDRGAVLIQAVYQEAKIKSALAVAADGTLLMAWPLHTEGLLIVDLPSASRSDRPG